MTFDLIFGRQGIFESIFGVFTGPGFQSAINIFCTIYLEVKWSSKDVSLNFSANFENERGNS